MVAALETLAAGPASRRAFDHVLIIMFENQYRGYVLGNPYMRRLARPGIQLGNCFGVMHASQTNYIVLLGGALCNVREAPLLKVMEGYVGQGVDAMWDGAPTDFNVREDHLVEALEQVLVAFAKGRAASIMTITCANADTYEQATRDPEKYDLLRARMGGWTEFFVTMFPAHQAQHQQRPIEMAQTLEGEAADSGQEQH